MLYDNVDESTISDILISAHKINEKEIHEFFIVKEDDLIDNIKKYIETNNVVYSEINSLYENSDVDELKYHELKANSYKFILFSNKGNTFAKTLCNHLYSLNDEMKLVFMKTYSDTEYGIVYDGIEFVKIYHIPIHHNVNLLNIISKDNKILPEIELIQIYTNIYSTSEKKSDDSDINKDYELLLEEILFNKFSNNNDEMKKGGIRHDNHDEIFDFQKEDVIHHDYRDEMKEGGFDIRPSSESQKKSGNSHNEINDINILFENQKEGGNSHNEIDDINILFENQKEGGNNNIPAIKELRKVILNGTMFQDKKMILLGEAFKLLHDNSISDKIIDYEFDCISEFEIDTIIEIVNKYAEKLSNFTRKADKLSDDIKIHYKSNKDQLYFDFRSIRYTIFAKVNNEEHVLFYCYNTAQYDLIPFISVAFHNQLIGVAIPAVILRFLFNKLFINKFRFIISNKTPQNQNRLLSLIKECRELFLKYPTVDKLNESYFVEYCGIYENELIAKKKLMLENGSYPYYPALKRAQVP
jgi:hypothetical protein